MHSSFVHRRSVSFGFLALRMSPFNSRLYVWPFLERSASLKGATHSLDKPFAKHHRADAVHKYSSGLAGMHATDIRSTHHQFPESENASGTYSLRSTGQSQRECGPRSR